MALSVRTTRVPVLMLKWLIFLVFAAILFYGWRQKRRRPEVSAVDRLVRCTRCGRHLSIHAAACRGDGDYRCPQHAGDNQ
ncbi:MAG TPA: hypothetical protein VMV63_04720 [Acidithiobacillus sp.]|nr:hypothetical protein [Acidithiobacillus sp.]